MEVTEMEQVNFRDFATVTEYVRNYDPDDREYTQEETEFYEFCKVLISLCNLSATHDKNVSGTTISYVDMVADMIVSLIEKHGFTYGYVVEHIDNILETTLIHRVNGGRLEWR